MEPTVVKDQGGSTAWACALWLAPGGRSAPSRVILSLQDRVEVSADTPSHRCRGAPQQEGLLRFPTCPASEQDRFPLTFRFHLRVGIAPAVSASVLEDPRDLLRRPLHASPRGIFRVQRFHSFVQCASLASPREHVLHDSGASHTGGDY